jgi:large repetitive protein
MDLPLGGTVRAIALAILVLGLGFYLALRASEASAGQLSCGDEITADTTLDNDLVDCPNNGVVIAAAGVTLDLNGHTIDGDGSEFAGCGKDEICDVGVVNDGRAGVTVRNGSVRDFAVGVLVGGARRNRVVEISATRHTFFGAVFGGATRSVIRRSSFSRNIAPDGDGIGMFESDHIRIVRSKIRRNPGPGIHLEDSHDNLIKGNVFTRNGPGILMQGNRNEVRRNRFARDGGVLVAPGDRNVVAGNRVSRSFEGIAIEDGRANLVARNVVVDSPSAGIRLAIRRPSIGGAANVVRRNLVRRSGEDGFIVHKKDHGSLLRRNIAVSAGDDGFDVISRSTTLTGNRAARNGDLGIEAVAGVIDGGGNKARGNGNPVQCTNVACS